MEGARRIQEKNTARLGEKARFGRKVGGICPPSPSIQEKITARLAEKASSGRKVGGICPPSPSIQEEITARLEKTCGIFPCQKDTIEG